MNSLPVLLALLSVGLGQDVVDHVISEDNSRTLSCSRPQPWFFCVWEGPREDRLCSLRSREGGLRERACGYEDSRLELLGNATHCQLVIRDVDISDHGDWTCALTDDNMETVKQVTAFNVMKHGNISLEVAETGERETADTFEGERLEVRCRLEQVWPPASVLWRLEREGKEVVGEEREELEVEVEEEVVESECDLCPVSVEQRLSLVPGSRHSGLLISCHQPHSPALSSLQVTVITPTQADLERLRHDQGLGLMPGILVSSILVLLSLAVLVSFCIRGSRNRKQKKSHSESEDPEIGKSFVDNENIVKGENGAADMIENVYDEANKDSSFTESSIDSSDNGDNNISDSVSPSEDGSDKQDPSQI